MTKPKYKPKHTSYNQNNPQLEKCPILTDLSITINASDTFPTISVYLKHYVYKIRKYLLPYMNIKVLYPEFSSKGRLHYHGIIQFKTHRMCVDWYYKYQHIDGLNIKIDTINDAKVWQDYITKQNKYMSSYIKPYQLTSTILSQHAYSPQSTCDQFKHGLEYGLPE